MIKTKLQLGLITSLTIFLIAIIWVISGWLYFLYRPLGTEVKFLVRDGSSMATVINELSEYHIIQHPALFRLLVKYRGVANKLKAGEYLFQKNANSSKILEQIVTGKGMVHHLFTIIPGWKMQDIRDALARDVAVRNTIQHLTDDQIMKQLGFPNLKAEGQFFPDTYFFVLNTQDLALLKRAFKKMQNVLNTQWEHRAPNLPFKNKYEALIGASIIVKEADLDTELPKIAGVLINRLKKNMLLQFDPTVIYGLGNHFEGVIRKSDLKADTPFNTYVHKGLPPTPISMPHLVAIQAILHPERHDYYYFVAKGDGSHQFSKELSEHYKAVQAFQKNKSGFYNKKLIEYYFMKLSQI